MAIETYVGQPVITVAQMIVMLQSMPQEMQLCVDDSRGLIGARAPTIESDVDDTWVQI